MFGAQDNPPGPDPVYAEVNTVNLGVLFMHDEFFCTIML